MALAKCPDCKKQISDKAKSCPFCGCPAEFFENIKKEVVEVKKVLPEKREKIVLEFAGEKVCYLKKDIEYISLVGCYVSFAELLAYAAELSYTQAGDIATALARIPKNCEKIVELLLDLTIQALYHMGSTLTVEEFLIKYMNKYSLLYETFYTPIVEQYAAIKNEAEQLEMYREAIKASRGKWVGGGFGITGAIKGAITASILNCGTNFINSFGDSARERRDNEIIRAKLKELYNQPSTKHALCNGLRMCVLNMEKALREELINSFDVNIEYHIDYEKAMSLYNNTIKYEKEAEKKKQNIVQCLFYYPGNVEFYKQLSSCLNEYEENDIVSFIELWGIRSFLTEWGDELQFETWDFKIIINKFYDKYQGIEPSGEIRKKRKKAQEFTKKNRTIEDKNSADNICRRMEPLLYYIKNKDNIINKHIYALSQRRMSVNLINNAGIDEWVFFDNSELIITDYSVYINEKSILISQINELCCMSDQDKRLLVIYLKNGQGNIVEAISKKDTEIATLILNVAIEPYCEVSYVSNMDGYYKERYIELVNKESVKKIDSSEDKKRKKQRQNFVKKDEKREIEQMIKEVKSEEEIESAQNIRRRFGKILSEQLIGTDCIYNEYIYELNIKRIKLPEIMKYVPYEKFNYLFWGKSNVAVTDYEVFVVTDKKKDDKEIIVSVPLRFINEIYCEERDGRKYLKLVLKKERDVWNDLEGELGIDITYNASEYCLELFYLLNIILEPYKENDYISKICDAAFDLKYNRIVDWFQEKYGGLQKYVEKYLDNETDKAAKKELRVAKEKRCQKNKEEALYYREQHKEPMKDSFAVEFSKRFRAIYEQIDKVDVYSHKVQINQYDYELFENAPIWLKNIIMSERDKGQIILYASPAFTLTDRNIYLHNKKIVLWDIAEILNGEIIKTDEADFLELTDDYDRTFQIYDHEERYAIVYKNGHTECIKENIENGVVEKKILYALNYVLDSMYGGRKRRYFANEKICFCSKCGSCHIEISDGFLGTKYKCLECGSSGKSKICIYYGMSNETTEKIEKSMQAYFQKTI